ncbi:MAG: MBL fold metallo-hydrolase, partial [Verrucomicrobiaceae bacterium]|nr:MBL fold metallo-hydrolase [Verrucomicrobiaceae bacterium]
RPGWPTAPTRIEVLDLGAGAAVHLHAGGEDWLIDCGSQRDFERVLVPYLHWAGVNRLDGLILTHGDSMHIGAAALVVDEFKPRSIIDNPASDQSSVHRKLRLLLKEQNQPVTFLTAGDTFRPDSNVEARLLYPRRGFKARKGDDQAFVTQLRLASGTRVLLVSDSGLETEKALITQAELRSDIMIKGQHSSGISGSEEFLNVVAPKLIVATSRDFPHRERLSDEWVENVRKRGVQLFRQDESGAVQLDFRSSEWSARGYITGQVFRSSSR